LLLSWSLKVESCCSADQEKLYAHYLSVGSWGGALACLAQTSPETPPLFLTLFKLFSADPPEQLEAKAKSSVFNPRFAGL
jgi:hypothetical protein